MLNTLSPLARKTRKGCQLSAGGIPHLSGRQRSPGQSASVAVLCLFSVLILSSCSPAAILTPTAVPVHWAPFYVPKGDPNLALTATPFLPDTSVPLTSEPINLFNSPVPPTDAPAPATNTPLPPTAAPTTDNTQPTADPGQASSDRTHYTFYVNLDYGGKAVAVNETVRYVNTTGQSLDSIVMAVEPNLWGNCFTLATLSEDDQEATNYDLSGHRLTIHPAQPLAAGAVTTFDIGYSLALPVKSYDGTFGYISTQLNLTDWYPFVVPYIGGWVLHDNWAFGEYLAYDVADFDVYLKVSDPDVIVAASAPGEASGDTTHYHMESSRNFVLSASDSYKVDESAVGSVKIKSYYFPGDGNASQAVVWMATQSLALYGAKFAPYPQQSLSIVETSLPDGQEFDGLVFLGSNFYSSYNGSARSNLFTIGTHEIAHQWWYGLVGDDQAMEPWLDEALSVYSERIFYEYNYPSYGDWWWNFRVNYFGPQGYVDSNIYSFGTFRSYVNAVYLNGANFMDDLRTRIGDDAFFAFIKDYASEYSNRIATGSDFFAVLRQHTNKNFSDIMQSYFQGSY